MNCLHICDVIRVSWCANWRNNMECCYEMLWIWDVVLMLWNLKCCARVVNMGWCAQWYDPSLCEYEMLCSCSEDKMLCSCCEYEILCSCCEYGMWCSVIWLIAMGIWDVVLILMRNMWSAYIWRDAFICVTWLIHICDGTHSNVWHDSFLSVIWLICICVTWCNHICDMTDSFVWHDSLICMTCLIYLCDMALPYSQFDRYISIIWLFIRWSSSPWASWPCLFSKVLISY